MYNKVTETIFKHNMLSDGDKVVVGVSGGADSSALLHILKRLSQHGDGNSDKVCMNLSVCAVHIHHGIRGKEADGDENFVKEMCRKLNVDFISFHFDIKKEAKKYSLTEEEAGRKIRYECFEKVCKEYGFNKIAVAHNMNDNAETMLMRFIRGTGIKGLGGIVFVRGKIVRPLIMCGREEIENYCTQNNISFRSDSTNFSDVYTRNKIRLNLIPWIQKEMNRDIIKTLSKTAEIVREEENFIEKYTEKAFSECFSGELSNENELFIYCEKLQKQDDVIKRRVIRKACRVFSEDLHDISFKHVNMVCNLTEKQTGKSVDLPFGLTAVKNYEYIKIFNKNSLNNNFSLQQNLFFSFDIVYNDIIYIDSICEYFVISEKKPDVFSKKKPTFAYSFNPDKICGKLVIRNRLPKDKIFISGVDGNKKLKKLFIDKKIPKEQREQIPVLADENGVLCVVGVRVSDFYKADKNIKNKIYLYVWEDLK